MKRFLVCILLSCHINFVHAAAVPAYSGGINNAVGSIIQTKTTKWGFAANDPRFGATVSAVGTAATTVAVGLATGAVATVGWPALLIGAGVSAVATGAVSLGMNGLINWLWPDSTHSGQVQLSGTGMNGTVPIFSSGITAGQLAWTAGSGYWGSPQEALAYIFSQTIAQYPTATYSVPVLTQNSGTQYTATYTYSIPPLFLNNQNGSKTITATTWNGITCPAGSGFVSGTTCTSAGLANSPYASATYTPIWQTPTQAIAALPQSYTTQPLSDTQLATIANTLWKNMSSAANTQTIPWNAADPVTPADITTWKAANPGLVPTVNDFLSPVAAPGATSIPIPNPGANTGTSTTPATTTPGTTAAPAEINWGDFTEPTLDATPTTGSILDPIFNMWPQWNGYAFPSHTSQCPTPTFVALNHTFTFDHMCTWVEMIRSGMQAAFALMWALAVVFIVMGA